jgi:hypothetical protein
MRSQTPICRRVDRGVIKDAAGQLKDIYRSA